MGALSLALGAAGVGILALTPELATLEDLFFRLTEAQRRPADRSAPPPRSSVPAERLTAGSERVAVSTAQRRPARRGASPMHGRPRATVYRWELRKLISQKRTYLGLGLAGDPAADLRGGPEPAPAPRHGRDNIFAAQITQSGLATPVLMLLFLSVFMLPLIAALVAGDIVAAEDGNGTLKTILTRSVDRGQVFAAKALAAMTYADDRGVPVGRRGDRRRRRLVGLSPRRHLLGHRRLGAGRPAARVRRQRRLPDPAADRGGDRRAAVDHHPQQRRGRGRHGRHRDPAVHRRADPGPRRHQALSAHRTVRELARPAAHAHRLGADLALAVGLRAVRGPSAVRGATWCSCGATSPAADRRAHRAG